MGDSSRGACGVRAPQGRRTAAHARKSQKATWIGGLLPGLAELRGQKKKSRRLRQTITLLGAEAMEWAPYAETYPLLEGEEYQAFKEDLRRNGQQESIKYRMADCRKQGLDGRNRERALLELKREPRYEKVFLDDGQVKAYIDSRNLHRRHLSKEDRQAII
jgi:hypothetical protein